MMPKRVTWFVVGAAAGIGTTVAAGRKVRRTVHQLAPSNVARRGFDSVRTTASDVLDAAREGREAMAAKESELRARLRGDTPAGVDPARIIDLTTRMPRTVRDRRA